jgi:hypothetical protein
MYKYVNRSYQYTPIYALGLNIRKLSVQFAMISAPIVRFGRH